ncbi:hypothetical protein BDV26DRAFT_259114 [Aspergillus bertholletiae]|uniref:Uncharacterized protein n=1 Tax=Aspergillus bertholletiae TaxID=1226010 RepID=A0A5N7BD04_9EURO|nr:hypothetical protein BDV26DRAFT_259114 [Aspergillus bertholletiae]
MWTTSTHRYHRRKEASKTPRTGDPLLVDLTIAVVSSVLHDAVDSRLLEGFITPPGTCRL